MADPISILGATAAAVQFSDVAARALIESIKLLKNLNETPKRMQQQLHDVTKSIERIFEFRSTILTPGSSVFIHLTTQQLKRIDEAVSDADVAMKSLHQSLHLLFPQQTSTTNNALKSLWRAVVSITREKDIQEKVERINYIHQELMRELLVTDLELHTSARDLNSRIISIIEASRQDTQSSQNAWETTGALLQSTADLTIAEVARVSDNTASMVASVDRLNTYSASITPSIARIQETAISTQQELEQLRLDFTTFQKVLGADMDAKLLKEREHNRAEILSLRDALLRLVTRDRPDFSDYERVSAAQLSESTKRSLGIQTRRQLLHCPSLLQQTADNCNRKIYHSTQPMLQCHCRPSQTLVTMRRGALGFEYNRCAHHDPNCLFYQSHARSWLLTLTIKLLPFLQKTVALTVGATFGAGSWAIASPLRFYATTERAKSPLFNEFDEFARIYKPLAVSKYSYRGFEWDITRVAPFLDNLIEKLSSSFRAGNASGNDMDEFGNTMLHEIVLLINLLGYQCESVTVQLQELIRLALLSGVDKFARSEKNSLDYRKITRGYFLYVNYTETSSISAMEILVGQILFTDSSSFHQVEIPIYDTIKLFDLEDSVVWDKVFDYGDRYLQMNFTRRSEKPLKLITTYPEFIEQLDYGELVAPILRRSIAGLRHAIVSPNYKKALESKYGTFHPLKLAVGWPTGIKILMEEKCFTIEAIELAIRTNNIESLEILLSEWSDNPVDWWLEKIPRDNLMTDALSSYHLILEQASLYGSNEIRYCVVWYANRFLWNINGPKSKYVKKAESVKSVASGEEFSPCSPSIPSEPNNNISAYHFWDGWEGATKVLDTLYGFGITAIDLKCQYEESPLLYRLCRFRNTDIVPEAIIWFIQKGASPNFDTPYSWPNIFFYLPLVMTFNKTSRGRLESAAPFYRSICDPFQTDGCQCYCSLSGCLPFFQTMACRVDKDFPRWHNINCSGRTRVKFENLEDWARMHGVQDCQMAKICTETCRLEVFDRLGMAHTCCSIEMDPNEPYIGEWTARFWRKRFPEAERERLQDEDSELREQLDLIMEAYERMRKKYFGSLEGFWERWWQTLGNILPDLLPVERCKWATKDFYITEPLEEEKKLWQQIYDRRARREREALRNGGYLGLDFIDVIRLHFKDYLM